MRPYVGRRPTVPQAVLGETMEPRVSVPSAKPTRPAAVDAAEPAEDPLEPRSYSPFSLAAAVGQGLLVWPLAHWSPMASAPMESLANRTAPALKRRSTQVASASGMRSSKGSAPHWVGM